MRAWVESESPVISKRINWTMTAACYLQQSVRGVEREKGVSGLGLTAIINQRRRLVEIEFIAIAWRSWPRQIGSSRKPDLQPRNVINVGTYWLYCTVL